MTPLKAFAKRCLYAVAPRAMTSFMSARARAHSHRVVKNWGCDVVNRKLIERFGATVQSGPFAGLALTPMTYAEQLGPFLLGLYESELDAAWDIVFRGSYTQLVDVGAKFGYYAVGLARRYPKASVVAFDTDPWARRAVGELAAANGTPNVRVAGFCSPAWIARHAEEASFILSDCEGYEAQLFDFKGAIPNRLRSATLLIETHDTFSPGVTEALRAAFASTHALHLFGGPDAPRRAAPYPLEFLNDAECRLATHEVRGEQRWLLCLPKTGPNAALSDLLFS